MPEVKRASTRWRPSDGKGKVVGLYICTMRRYAPSQYRQVLLLAPTAALYCISSPTTASTFALACCDDFCQRRAKLYLTYCKRAFGKPQSGKGAQQARANAYFFRRSVACIAIPRQNPTTQTNALQRKLFFLFGAALPEICAVAPVKSTGTQCIDCVDNSFAAALLHADFVCFRDKLCAKLACNTVKTK